MEKRTWHYVLEPFRFDMHCDKCEGTNITWSEYVHKIWCYDCKIYTEGFKGVFGGPIPVYGAELMGLCFDIYNMETGKIEKLIKESDSKSMYVVLTDAEMKENYRRIDGLE